MTRTNLFTSAARWAVFVALAATPLAGCKPATTSDQAAPSDAIPLASGAAPAIAAAPAASALPPAPTTVPVGRLANPSDRYAFADRAYAMNNAFADAPPDYGFDYDGTQPWVWRGGNGAMRVAEPLPNGGDRYYYYQPGADYPYLVRDPEYSYGYDQGELVVIYDQYGRPLPDDQFAARQDYASRFFYRGRSIYSSSQQQRQAVAQDNWAARRRQYEVEQSRWASDQQNDTDWRDYHAAHEDQYQSQWSAEQARRATEGAAFAIIVNDVVTANRDKQIAQQAQAHAGPPPQQGPNILGLHLGGGATPPSSPPPVAPASPAAPPHMGPTPGAPATPTPPQPGAPTGGDHHHDHTPGAPAGGEPLGQPHRDTAPTYTAPAVPAAPAARPPVFAPRPTPAPTPTIGQQARERGGFGGAPGAVRVTPPMQPQAHAAPAEPRAAEPRPAEPRAPVVRPAEPAAMVARPVPPKPVVATAPVAPRVAVVKPAPSTPPLLKRPPQDKDVPNKQ